MGKALLWFVGILAVLTYCTSGGNRPNAAATKAADPMAGVRGACMLFLERRLHDPSSAEFGLLSDWPASRNGDGTFTVRATYRARNSFNAMRQESRTCTLRLDGDGWRAVDIR